MTTARPGRRPPTAGDLAEVERALSARWPETRLEPSLQRISALMEHLDNPQRRVPVVHVTGTNGKTTTARMVDELLRAHGLRVGRFTSPHLTSIRERIVLDGAPLAASSFTAMYDRLRPALARVDAGNDVPLSFFEVVTAMAFVAFADARLDVAVVEVGMGGTWDATNVADGRVAVVTPVSLDHTEYLGPDETSIAAEKAGIIKPGALAVLARQIPSAEEVLLRRVGEVGARAVREGREYGVVARQSTPAGQLLGLRSPNGRYEGFLPLLGAHQARNAATALTAAEAFLADAGATLDAAAVRRGLVAVRSPGRLEPVRTAPTVLVDASHNPTGMAATVEAVRETFPRSRLTGVFAALQGKDVLGMLRLLDDVLTDVVVTQNSSPRSMPAEELADRARSVLGAGRVTVEPHLPAAIDTALRRAAPWPEDLPDAAVVLVTGSVVTAGEARALLTGGAARDPAPAHLPAAASVLT